MFEQSLDMGNSGQCWEDPWRVSGSVLGLGPILSLVHVHRVLADDRDASRVMAMEFLPESTAPIKRLPSLFMCLA